MRGAFGVLTVSSLSNGSGPRPDNAPSGTLHLAAAHPRRYSKVTLSNGATARCRPFSGHQPHGAPASPPSDPKEDRDELPGHRPARPHPRARRRRRRREHLPRGRPRRPARGRIPRRVRPHGVRGRRPEPDRDRRRADGAGQGGARYRAGHQHAPDHRRARPLPGGGRQRARRADPARRRRRRGLRLRYFRAGQRPRALRLDDAGNCQR